MSIATIKKSSLQKTAAILIISAIMVIFMLNPNKYRISVLEGIATFGLMILPAALPFFFFSKLLLELGVAESLSKLFAPVTRALYGCRGETSYVFIMSVLSGYPVGAKLIREMYDNNVLSPAECRSAISFCSTSGPLFIIGSVGVGIFASIKLGVILLCGHIAGALLNGLLYRHRTHKSATSSTQVNKQLSATVVKPLHRQKPLDTILSDTIYSTMIQLLIIGGYVTLFFLLADIAKTTGITRPLEWLAKNIFRPMGGEGYATGFVSGLIEMTRGNIDLGSFNPQPNNMLASLSAFIIAWGGLSVHLQNISFLLPTKVTIRFYLLTKTTQAIITTFVTLLLWLCFG